MSTKIIYLTAHGRKSFSDQSINDKDIVSTIPAVFSDSGSIFDRTCSAEIIF